MQTVIVREKPLSPEEPTRGLKRVVMSSTSLDLNHELTLPSKRVKRVPIKFRSTPNEKSKGPEAVHDVYSPFQKVEAARRKKFLAKLESYRRKEYCIDGHPVKKSFFAEIYTPQNWVDTPHM
ncbi:hypothetical protein CARUB_v10024335mg [Capsella rubella]|uniref:Uncharacterized protein n=1 Tax=Capsella rubella TaxID=81985 RepID=R0HS26_9BRAS|nr:hypothetical protein CARUB_v10024335mg [Capsella rubella]